MLMIHTTGFRNNDAVVSLHCQDPLCTLKHSLQESLCVSTYHRRGIRIESSTYSVHMQASPPIRLDAFLDPDSSKAAIINEK